MSVGRTACRSSRSRRTSEVALNIEVTRSGGFAGITRSSSAPEEELPADLQQPFRSLLAAPPDSPGSPDRFVYTLKHGDQEVTVGETSLDEAGKRLMQWVLTRKP